MDRTVLEEGSFEVRNRYGDVVQRGVVTEVEPRPGELRSWVFNEPLKMRHGDRVDFTIPGGLQGNWS